MRKLVPTFLKADKIAGQSAAILLGILQHKARYRITINRKISLHECHVLLVCHDHDSSLYLLEVTDLIMSMVIALVR